MKECSRAGAAPRFFPFFFAALVAAFAVIFHHNFFYSRGCYLLDAGWNAFVLYRSGINPLTPSVALPHPFPPAFFAQHICPFMIPFSLASYAVPLNRLDWFGLCMALFYGLYAYAACAAANRFLGEKSTAPLLIGGALLGVVSTANGFTISCFEFPHYEMAFVGFAACFLLFLFERRLVPASIFFALACLVREDTGFHLSAILFMLWLAGYFDPRFAIFRKHTLVFGSVSFSASITLLAIQKLFYPSPISALQLSFFNNEPFRLTAREILERLADLPVKSLHLLLPLAVTAIWATLAKRPVLLLGWLAYLPWFALNFIAREPARQVFHTYHGFPFFLSLLWPLLVSPPLDAADFCAVKKFTFALLLGFSSLIGFSISGHSAFHTFLAHAKNFSWQEARPLEDLGDVLRAEPERYGRLGLDSAATCVFLDWAKHSQVHHYGQHYDTVIFFKDAMFTTEMVQLALRDKLSRCYKVAGTNVLVMSNRELPALTGGRTLLALTDYWLTQVQFDPRVASRLPDGSIAQTSHDGAGITFGPYVSLQPGNYRLRYHLGAVADEDLLRLRSEFGAQPVAILDVASRGGNFQIAVKDVMGANITEVQSLEFEIPRLLQNDAFEFRVFTLGRGRVRIAGIELEQL